jgi:hypothetical protein
MTTVTPDYSGLHYRSFEWFCDNVVNSIVNPIASSIDRRGPSHEQITSLYEKFNSLTGQLIPSERVDKTILENTVRRVNLEFGSYDHDHKTGCTTIIERGSTYHKMKAGIEAAKGNRTSAITHRLKAAGYCSLALPATVGILAYFVIGYAWLGIPEIASLSYKGLKSPDKLKRISGSIRKFRVNRQAKQSLRREMNSRFQSLVDEEI